MIHYELGQRYDHPTQQARHDAASGSMRSDKATTSEGALWAGQSPHLVCLNARHAAAADFEDARPAGGWLPPKLGAGEGGDEQTGGADDPHISWQRPRCEHHTLLYSMIIYQHSIMHSTLWFYDILHNFTVPAFLSPFPRFPPKLPPEQLELNGTWQAERMLRGIGDASSPFASPKGPPTAAQAQSMPLPIAYLLSSLFISLHWHRLAVASFRLPSSSCLSGLNALHIE